MRRNSIDSCSSSLNIVMETSNFEHEVTHMDRTSRGRKDREGFSFETFGILIIIFIYLLYISLDAAVESESGDSYISTISHGMIRLHTVTFSPEPNTITKDISTTTSATTSFPVISTSSKASSTSSPVISTSSKASSMCYFLPFAIGEKYGKFRKLLEDSWLGNDILLYWILVDYDKGPYYMASNKTIFVSMIQKEDYRTVKEKVANAFIYIAENLDLFTDCAYFLKIDYDMYINTKLMDFTFSRWPSTQTYFGQMNPRFNTTIFRLSTKPNKKWWGTPMWTTFGFTRDFMPRVAAIFQNHTTDRFPAWVTWDDQMAGFYMMKNGIPGYPLGLYRASNALNPKWKMRKNFNRTEKNCRKYAANIYDPCILYFHALKWHRRCLYGYLHEHFSKESDEVFEQCLDRQASEFKHVIHNIVSYRNGTLGEMLGLLSK